MFRRISLLALFSLIVSPIAFARSERIRITRSSLWEVNLAGNARVLSKEQPTLQGTIVVFHRYPDGALIGLPKEQVVSVQRRGWTPYVLRASSGVRQAQPLAPGGVVDLGETGGGPTLSTDISTVRSRPYSPSSVGEPLTTSQDPGRLAIDAAVFRGDTLVPGSNGGGASQFGYTAGGMVLNPTLANRGTTPVTSGPNGFPATAAGQPINPNGFPTTTAGPESGTQPINPNGFPAMTTTGPQSGVQPIDSNGFPSLTTPPNAGSGRSTTQPRSPSPR